MRAAAESLGVADVRQIRTPLQLFNDWLTSTDTVVLNCWDMGHVWSNDLYSSVDRGPHGQYLLIGYCQRPMEGIITGCGTKRTRILSSTFSPEGNKNLYTYPKLYSPRELEGLEEGFFMDKTYRALIRKELYRRAGEGHKRASSRRSRAQAHP